MKSLEHAKRRGRDLRREFDAEPRGLLGRIENYFIERGFTICAVERREIGGQRARLTADGYLYYDKKLDGNLAKKLFIFAHELGHLILHERLSDPCARPDPLRGAEFANAGAWAIARYHSRVYEEAEATAFAVEFLAPCDELFGEWLTSPDATSTSIAERLGVPQEVVRVQLVEGLYSLSQTSGGPDDEGSEADSTLADISAQTAAAKHLGSPALVNAGPGTGKTTTLVMRVEFLLKECGASPEEMLILTFSNEAAATLRTRISELMGDDVAGRIEINTFHGFGYSFMLVHGGEEVDPETIIIDEAAQAEIFTKLLGRVACDTIIKLRDPSETAEEVARHVNHLKERGVTPDALELLIKEWEAEEPDQRTEQRSAREVLAVYQAYEEDLPKIPAADFSDLITVPLRLLEKDAPEGGISELARRAREKYRWVMVDEYQDVNRSVARLLRLICGPDNPPWVVGDPRQSIYRFLGATPENVLRFAEDFEDSAFFDLDVNFRSCEEVVQAANQLAALIEDPDHKGPEYRRRWQRGKAIGAFGTHPVAIATANSDAAEYSGIAAHVRGLVEEGVLPGQIAVLARRNIDVRNLVLALGREEVRATASGVLTPEGAAGDLAAVLTLPDAPQAVLGRVVYALGRKRLGGAVLNSVVERLATELEEPEGTASLLAEFAESAAELLGEVRTLRELLRGERFSADGFALLCAFLFDGSSYLRNALGETDEIDRALVLGEVLTVLTRAASYRFAHPHSKAMESRVGFSERLRLELAGATSNRTPPRPQSRAVRVMTGHAAKGLEFPFVVVAGQSLSPKERKWWLPPALWPTKEADRAQADSLLFVGVTRAKRAVLVSHAESKSAGKKKTREATTLLDRWREGFGIPSLTWDGRAETPAVIRTESVWGGSLRRGPIAARALSKKSCPIRTYLEDFVGVRFPSAIPALYPRYYVAARYAMEQVVFRAQNSGRPIPAGDAAAFFGRSFTDEFSTKNPLFRLYERKGIEGARRFAEVYTPSPRAAEFYDVEDAIEEVLGEFAEEDPLPLRLDVVSYFRGEDGQDHAILFRPESLAAPKDGAFPEELAWSKISDPGRTMALLLLRHRDSHLQPWVFSAADGALYRYRWNRSEETMDGDTAAAMARLRAISRRRFEWQIDNWACESCPCRINCPYWIGAVRGNAAPPVKEV